LRLDIELFGATFQNPVLLSSGTCGFGRELADVLDLEVLGGFVTKSVTLEPRAGNPAPRVAEFGAGMLNSVGLANPGLDVVRREKLPWIRDNVRRPEVFVSVAGERVEEYQALVEALDDDDGFLGFELNLSCPNVSVAGGRPFALDPDAVRSVVEGCRVRTERPLLAKLAPNDPSLETTVGVATDAGADGLTLVNTLPGVLLHGDGAPELGAGPGGMSGPALRPVGLLAVRRARRATRLPLVGVGGVSHLLDAVAYARAGASLVQVGTANFADPRVGARIVRDLTRWGARQGVACWGDLVAPAAPPAAGDHGVGPTTGTRTRTAERG
jgi:dihydroorotate dehydrogenase (NAD+) catalytic subunit